LESRKLESKGKRLKTRSWKVGQLERKNKKTLKQKIESKIAKVKRMAAKGLDCEALSEA
jgi:hypothetical protein